LKAKHVVHVWVGITNVQGIARMQQEMLICVKLTKEISLLTSNSALVIDFV